MPHKDPAAAKAYFREHYRKNREKKLAYAKAYREANPEAVADAKKVCYDRIKDDPEFKRRRSEYQRKRRSEEYEKVTKTERMSREKRKEQIAEYHRSLSRTPQRRARTAVNRAVRNGKLPRVTTLFCQECGSQAAHYHHHKGYERQHYLEVVPVCVPCHQRLDGLSLTFEA